MEINSFLLREKTPNITLGAAGPVGTAAATVDIVSHMGVTASAAALTFTLPVPTDARSGRDFRVTNTGANAFTIGSKLIGANDYADFSWDAGSWHAEAPTTASGSDFWRTDPSGQMPDGATDPADAIVRTGQTKIDTGAAGDSGLTLDDLRSRNSVYLTAGDTGVTDTNMTAIGVDTLGKVRLSNQLSIPDIRTTNPAPQDYAAGFSNVFKGAANIGLTSVDVPGSLPAYVNLQTTRRYASGTDFSGGQVRQDVDLEDGRQYFRLSTGATSWGPWQQESKRADDHDLQKLLTLNGRARVSRTGQISWDNQFRTMSAGIRPQETTGYHDIQMPAVGANVLVSDGTNRVVAAAVAGDMMNYGGIQLNAWETLWYNIRWGTSNASDPTRYRIQRYQDSGVAANGLLGLAGADAEEWVIICQRDDSNGFRWGNGDTVSFGSIIGTAMDLMVPNWTAMKTRAMGDGYFFSPGGNTTAPLAFGFTGTIRWINGGTQNFVDNNGYVDVSDARHAIGVVAQVSDGTTRTWRAMTATEKPSWFGGALRGNLAINPATTAVIDLNDNDTLYWVPDLISPSVGMWYIHNYAGPTVPIHALPVASRQITGGHSTIQVLVGGMQYALKAGDARYTTQRDSVEDILRRTNAIQFNGPAYCRFTTAAFFAGAAANGLLASANGVMVSWEDSRLMYGISDGYANYGDQYTWINVPDVGTQIPVVSTNSNVTRVVEQIGGHRYIPLSTWEALYWIPPGYSGGNNSAAGDFVISYYGTGNQHVPPTAIMIAKMFSAIVGNTNNKTRVKFADGSYIQPGLSTATVPATEYDHAQGSGDWRNVTIAGGTVAQRTSPGNNAALPAVAGIVGNYSAPYSMQFRYTPIPLEPRGQIELKGLISLNANITLADQNIAFIPGVQVYGEPIRQVMINNSTMGDNKLIPAEVRFINGTVGNQNGVIVRAYASSFNPTNNPYFTLGNNGGASAAGVSLWVGFDGIILPHN